MCKLRRIAGAALALSLLACEPPTDPIAQSPVPTPEPEVHRGRLVDGLSAGAGEYVVSGFNAQFSFAAIQFANGRAGGTLHHKVDLAGTNVEFFGRVTCLAVDSENGRAWVGGVITLNRSNSPSFQTAIHQQGKDIWFRVLDTGHGAAEADRTTFVGFEGSAGIQTSAEYCQVKTWPNVPPNDRTQALTSGGITVRP